MEFQPPNPTEIHNLQSGTLADSSVVYKAWQIITNNDWGSKAPGTVVEEMLDLRQELIHNHEYDLPLMLWLLSEVCERKDVVELVIEHGDRAFTLRPVLPHLTFPPSFFDNLLNTADQMLAAGSRGAIVRLETIELWSAKHPAEALAALNRRGDQATETSLTLLLGALSAGDPSHRREVLHIYSSWQSKTTEHQAVSVALASSLVGANLITEDSAIEHIQTSLGSAEERLWSPALRSLTHLLKISQSPNLLQLFRDLIPDPRPVVKTSLARVVAFSDDESLTPLASELLRNAVKADSSHKELVSNLDFVLSKLVERGDIHSTVDFLTRWVLSHINDEPKDLVRQGGFAHSFYTLNARHRDWLQRLVTRWLLDDLELLKRAEVIMEKFLVYQYDFGILMFIDDVQFKLLTDRALAIHLGGGDKTYKLLLSLSDYAVNTERLAALEEAFAEMAINYPGYTTRLLESHSARNAVEQKLLRTAEQAHSRYFKDRERPEMKEYYPPRTRYAKFMAYRQRFQSEVNEEIRKSGEFPLSSMMPTVIIARGDMYSTHYPNGSISEPSGFGQFSAEFELPRLWMVEPEHYEYQAKLVRRRVRRETGN